MLMSYNRDAPFDFENASDPVCESYAGYNATFLVNDAVRIGCSCRGERMLSDPVIC